MPGPSWSAKRWTSKTIPVMAASVERALEDLGLHVAPEVHEARAEAADADEEVPVFLRPLHRRFEVAPADDGDHGLGAAVLEVGAEQRLQLGPAHAEELGAKLHVLH